MSASNDRLTLAKIGDSCDATAGILNAAGCNAGSFDCPGQNNDISFIVLIGATPEGAQ